ncbi:MAG: peptide chain release factor N(5)-glutamine methyltransferase [Calditrichia bacterium]
MLKSPWTIQKVLQWTIEHFSAKQVPEPRLSAEILLAHVLRCKRLDLYLKFDQILTANELDAYRQAINRRVKFEPVQYITGVQEFMGLTFRVNPAVLIPRPETELLVERVIKDLKKMGEGEKRILDVGTGCGNIGISLAKLHSPCRVMAIDKSREAIELARTNAQNLQVQNIEFQVMDILDPQMSFPLKFDLVVSNPPYVSAEEFQELHPQVKDFEPRDALYAGPEGLDFIGELLQRLPVILKPGGKAYLEIGYKQAEKIRRLLDEANLPVHEFIKDYQNNERIVVITL